MPFTCALCQGEIGTGESMVADEQMNVAHEVCARRAVERKPSVQPPSFPLPVPAPVAVPPAHVCGRCRHGAPSVISCRRCYTDLCPSCAVAGCCGSRPAQHGEKTYCSVCGTPCKAMCPHCRKYVCNAYGMFNKNCGGIHEQGCPPAAAARNVVQKKEDDSPAVVKPSAASRTRKGRPRKRASKNRARR